jgi:hypothetical protein
MWRTLVDYAFRKSVSLSTLRRHIKSGKVQHRLEDGRYLVWDADPAVTTGQASEGLGEDFESGLKTEHLGSGFSSSLPPQRGVVAGRPLWAPEIELDLPESSSPAANGFALEVRRAAESQKIRALENELRRAQEEIAELRLLVSLYESQTSSSSQGREKTVN